MEANKKHLEQELTQIAQIVSFDDMYTFWSPAPSHLFAEKKNTRKVT